MSDQDEEFQQRWGFRRKESDLDSSSEDHSRPSSTSEPQLKKHKLMFSEENHQETINIESDPEAEVHQRSKEPRKEPSQSCKKGNGIRKGRKGERKVGSRKPTKTVSEHKQKPSDDDPLNDLSGHSESLIQGIKVARDSLLKWMSKEMGGKPIQDETTTSSKPNNGRKRAQNQNSRRTKSTRDNPKSAKTLQGKTVSHSTNKEIVKQSKGSENVRDSTTTVGKEAKECGSSDKQKRRRSGQSVNNNNKQKNNASVASSSGNDQLASKAAVVALPAPTCTSTPTPTPNYLTLPTVLPRKQLEKNPWVDGDQRDSGLNTGNIGFTSQMSCFPMSQPKDGVFAQDGIRNVSDYEHHTALTIGNMRSNGNGFSFPLHNGFPFSLHNPSQLGMHFLSQENRVSGLMTNGGNIRMPSGNHGFLESLNQHSRFKALGLPDNRGTNL